MYMARQVPFDANEIARLNLVGNSLDAPGIKHNFVPGMMEVEPLMNGGVLLTFAANGGIVRHFYADLGVPVGEKSIIHRIEPADRCGVSVFIYKVKGFLSTRYLVNFEITDKDFNSQYVGSVARKTMEGALESAQAVMNGRMKPYHSGEAAIANAR